MKIILIDDNKAFREGFKFYLVNKLGYDVVADYNDGDEFLRKKEFIHCDIILMDIDMPKVDGFKATKLALWETRDLKVIAITGFRDKAYLTDLITAGCKGCVFKENIYNELEEAIHTVMSGEMYYPDGINID